MSEKQEAEEIVLMDFALGIHPQTGEFDIWGEPYEVQAVDHEGGQWLLVYHPPVSKVGQNGNGFTVHATPRKSITRRFDSVAPILRNGLGDEAKRRKVGAPKKWNAKELEAQIKAAMNKLPVMRRTKIGAIAEAMGKGQKYLRDLCREHWPGIEPQQTIKRIAATLPNKLDT